MQVEAFKISTSDAELRDLADRLSRTRWPDQLDAIGWEQGTERSYLEDLVRYWHRASTGARKKLR
jgi:hypothetical protein